MDKATGFIESPKDYRDFNIGRLQAPTQFPETYLPDISNLPIYDQSKQPSCVGHASVWAVMYLHYLRTGEIRDYSKRFIYALCKRDDGFSSIDGTFYRQACKELYNYGVSDQAYFLDDTSLDRATYNNTEFITVDGFKNALPRSIPIYGQVLDLSFSGIKQAIYQNKVVIAGIKLDNNFWTDASGIPSWQEKDILPLRPPKSIISGHAIAFYGYDKDYIYFVNSWSKEWGRIGVGYFASNYLPFIQEAWTIVDGLDKLPKFNNNLYIGLSNDDVYRLQVRYFVEGLADYRPTGFFGAKTLASTVAYQKKYNIPATGFVGQLTRAKLNSQ